MVLRTPEKCIIDRLSAFSKKINDEFFRNLKEIFIKYPKFADGTRILNLDKTGMTIVVSKSTKVFAAKGAKSSHSISSRTWPISYCLFYNQCCRFAYAASDRTSLGKLSESISNWCPSRFSWLGLPKWVEEQQFISTSDGPHYPPYSSIK